MGLKKFTTSLLVGGLFVVNGCGGGGGSSLPSKPSASEIQKLNDSNSENAAAGSVGSIISSSKLSDNSIPGADLKIHSKLSKMAKLSAEKAYKTENMDICDSGTAKFDKKSDTSGTVIYNNCQIGDDVYNGKIKVDITLDGEEIQEVTAEYDNFTTKNESLNAYIEIKHAKIYMNRNSHSESISKLYATFNVDKKIQKYLNYNISLQNKEENNKETTIVKAKGYVKPYCLSSYVYVETQPQVKDIYDNESDDDSIYGKIKVESNSKSVTVEFDDKTVKITKPSGESKTMSLEEFDNKMKEKCEDK